MKILVTGCSGFIGKNYVSYLHKQNKHSVYCCNSDIDITNKDEIREILEDIKPEAIVHLAAKSVPGTSDDKWDNLWRVNVDGTRNLLHYAPKDCRFVLASSITVHGDGKFNSDTRFAPSTVYAASKISAEMLVESYTRLGRVRGTSMRLCAIVGPGLTHGVIKDFIFKLKNHEKLEILGSWPGSCKPYLHVSDVCSAIDNILNMNTPMSKVIVSANDSTTIDDIADICMQEWVKKEKVWLGEAANFAGDNRNVYTMMRHIDIPEWNWYPTHKTSKEAIRQCIKENL